MSVKVKNLFRKRGTFNELTSCRRTKSKHLKQPLYKVKNLEEFPPLRRHCSRELIGSCKKIDEFGEGELSEQYEFSNIQGPNEYIGVAGTPPSLGPASFVDAFSISTARVEPVAHSSADTTKHLLAPVSAPPLTIVPNVFPSPIQPTPTDRIPYTSTDRPVKSRTIHTLISPSEATSAVAPLSNSWSLQLSDQFGFSSILSSLEPLFQEGNLYAENYGYPTVPCDIFGTMVVRKISPVLSKRRDLKALFSPYARRKAELKSLF